jgi:predicted O-methyltransferase YrrM
LNVSANDGKILYDLVIKNGSKRALEIGTSTGHSGIWIAWALPGAAFRNCLSAMTALA